MRDVLRRNASSNAALAIAAAAIVSVFVLPWIVPSHVGVVISDSQALGFNNRVAMIGLAAGAVALFLFALVASRSRGAEGEGPYVSGQRAPSADCVSPWLLGVTIVLALVMVAGVGTIMQDRPIGDAGYFINALLRVAAGGAPYSAVEFSYGPLLLYGPLLTWRLASGTGLSLYPVYYAWVGLAQALGLAFAAYLLNRIQLSRTLRNTVFLAMGVFSLLQPELGLNYTWFRFLLPYVLFVWAMERLSRSPRGIVQGLLPLLAVVLAVSVSPEMGIALVVAFTVGLSFLVVRDSKSFLAPLAVMLLGTGLVAVGIVAAGAGTIGAFAGGAYYFPVLPGPPALIFVGAVLVMAWGVGSVFGFLEDVDAALQAGWVALALVLIAPALGRADFVHVFFNGIGAMLLGLAVIYRRWRLAGAYVLVAGGVFCVAMLLLIGLAFVGGLLDSGVRAGVIPAWTAARVATAVGQPRLSADLGWDTSAAQAVSERQAAEKLAEIPALAFPAPLRSDVGARLSESRQLVPLYTDPGSALNEADFRKVTRQLDAAQNLALPTHELESYVADARGVRSRSGLVMSVPTKDVGGLIAYGVLLGFPLKPRPRYPMFNPAASFGLLLKRDWIAYERIGDYTVLRRP